MIFVLARIEVAPGKQAAFLEEFHRLMPSVHAEAGCIEYGPAVDVETGMAKQSKLGDDVVMIVEKWESLAHLEAHLVAPHMTPYRERVKDIVKSTQLTVLEPA
ncbi:MAG: putative quinol monooxygenase [Planctomycetaceae bacterium]|nr:putative quinol monooxygenase [Planctomycetaceae bacterium]